MHDRKEMQIWLSQEYYNKIVL